LPAATTWAGIGADLPRLGAMLLFFQVAFAGFVSEIQNGIPLRLFPGVTYLILHDICLGFLAKFSW
jgi:hypothetical protein